MFRLFADENFDNDILRALKRDGVLVVVDRVQDIGLYRSKDPVILERAAAEEAIVLTHDRKTMPGFAFGRVSAGQPMSGVWVVRDTLSVADAVAELALLLACSEPAEWRDRVLYLPLQ
jgi:predicted nuclease of predicted toxin-antitoxin system